MDQYRQKTQEYDEVKERVFLAGANINNEEGFLQSMEELASLADACNMEVVGQMTQNLNTVNHGLFIGSGKVKEIKEAADELNVDMVIFDNAVSPIQLRNLQRELDMPVMDRTGLILEIFASRAKTREAKLQVEVARLQYMLPRLVGLHAALSRQGGGGSGGGSGGGTLSNKGSGEKKIELDRRTIEQNLDSLKRELESVSREKETQRKLRAASGIPRVALVGYTNAGKSTLMNRMVDEYMKADDKLVFEKDMLFATLETTVRKIVPERNKEFLLSDTVGFISKLPHGLVKAFRSTLDEVKEADLLLMVVDYSDPDHLDHLKVTRETLEELGAGEIPRIIVYNKADLLEDTGKLITIPKVEEDCIYMAAKQKLGLKELITMVLDRVYESYVHCSMMIPFQEGQVVGYLNQAAQIISTEYLEEGTLLVMKCSKADYNRYKKFVLE